VNEYVVSLPPCRHAVAASTPDDPQIPAWLLLSASVTSPAALVVTAYTVFCAKLPHGTVTFNVLPFDSIAMLDIAIVAAVDPPVDSTRLDTLPAVTGSLNVSWMYDVDSIDTAVAPRDGKKLVMYGAVVSATRKHICP
jgi:hypothetical protein